MSTEANRIRRDRFGPPAKTKHGPWKALNEQGQVVASAPSRKLLVDTFGDDFKIEGPK